MPFTQIRELVSAYNQPILFAPIRSCAVSYASTIDASSANNTEKLTHRKFETLATGSRPKPDPWSNTIELYIRPTTITITTTFTCMFLYINMSQYT